MTTALRRGFVFVGLVAVGLAALVPTGTADVAHCPDSEGFRGEIAQLCGKTRVRAASVAALDVVLSDPAMLSVPSIGRWKFTGSESNIALEGGGRFAGFVIERSGRERALAVGGRIDGARGWDFFNHVGFRSVPGGIELPAGSYRMILAPSAGTMSLTIDLYNLVGEASYTALDPVRNQIFSGRLADPLAEESGIYSLGLEGPRLAGRNLGLAAIWGTAPQHVVAAAGTCFYGPGGDANEEPQYVPGCPSRRPHMVESRRTIVSAPPTKSLVSHLKLVPGLYPGRWDIGAWMTAQPSLKNVKVALVWIDLN
jgi:hypothetical protein